MHMKALRTIISGAHNPVTIFEAETRQKVAIRSDTDTHEKSL